ncbi:MAG: biotin carboxylase N-terminal domain-containing protein [Desulfurococcaceae archaeon]
MPSRILIANRGEIAVRIAKTLIENSYIPVGVYTHDDADSYHRKFLAEDVEISSYMDIKEILNAAVDLGAEAIHPGYGFLSESAEFAREVTKSGFKFVGPSPDIIALTSDKIALKTYAERFEVPVLPWIKVDAPQDILDFGKIHGYPLIVKAARGGGGRGIRLIRGQEEVESAFELARREAEGCFKDSRLFVEPYVEHAKHIEVQVLGDGDNIVHLYERDCSLQRRYQKVVEEAPSPSITGSTRNKLCEYALRLSSGLKYNNAGTVEFIFDIKSGGFYLTEINSRLQVEHPVTEMITGIDIVKKQVEVALHSSLDLKQRDVLIRGHCIEARIYAENPYNQEPSHGRINKYKEPHGLGIRVDSGIMEGSRISDRYDPLIAKVIAWGTDRNVALYRLERALNEFIIHGNNIVTNIPLLKHILRSPQFTSAVHTTKFLEEAVPILYSRAIEESKVHATILASLIETNDKGSKTYISKEGLIKQVLRGENVSSLKRRAWYYYVAIRSGFGHYRMKQGKVAKGRSKRWTL